MSTSNLGEVCVLKRVPLIEVSVENCVKMCGEGKTVCKFFILNILIHKNEKIPGMNRGSSKYSSPLLTAGVHVRFEVLMQ